MRQSNDYQLQHESAEKSAKKDDNADNLIKHNVQILSLMVVGKEYTTECIVALIGMKGPRTRHY